MSCGIYKITNSINNKSYIGQSKSIEQRWKEHKNDSLNQNSEEYNYPLYQAFRKYGIDNFKFEILEECSQEELNDKEIYYISLYESYPPDKGKGYNQTPGGNQIYSTKLNMYQVQEIIEYLKDPSILMKDIALRFNIDIQSVSNINVGICHVEKGMDYPIRKRNKTLKTSKCIICGKQLKYYKSIICIKCRDRKREIEKPSKEELLKVLYDFKNNQKVANKYKISTVLLNKWMDELEIPRKRKDYIKKYKQEVLGLDV